jgi:vitamin B12 transporter
VSSGAVGAAEQASLDEVVVTAPQLEETLPEQLAKYGNRRSEISNESLRDGSYLDVAQGLQALTPGLYMLPKNGPFDYVDISLLGSRTDDVLWLVDGVRINNRLYSGTPPTDTLPAGMVDHIEVLEGGQALFYGTAAVAGAVNVVTRLFSDKPNAAVNLGGDTHSGRHADGFFSDGFGRHKVVAFASFDDSDGYHAFRRQDYQPSATDRERSFEVLTLGGKYAFDVSDDLRLSAAYTHTKADLDFAQPYRVADNVNTRREDLATLKVDYRLNDATSLFVKSYYHRWHTHIDTTYNSLTDPGAVEVLYDNAFWGYEDYGVNAMAQFSPGKGLDYFLGYDLQIYGGSDDVLVIEPNKERTHAVFAQARATPEWLPKAHFAVGFRFNAPDEGRNAAVWNLSGQYDFSRALFLRTTLGTNFRLPTAEELFANDPQYERGNPNLKPERSRSVNLSIGGGNGRYKWELVGFARDITDLIDYGVFDDATGQDVFDNVAGTVRVRGAELLLGTEFSRSMTANVSFLSSHSRQPDGMQLARVPKRMGKLNVDYHPASSPFGASVAVRLTGDVEASVAGNRIDYGNFAVVDLSARYFIDAGRKQRLTVSVQNLLDREYGRPSRGCQDASTDGPYDCSAPYIFTNRGLPRTAVFRYSYDF